MPENTETPVVKPPVELTLMENLLGTKEKLEAKLSLLNEAIGILALCHEVSEFNGVMAKFQKIRN